LQHNSGTNRKALKCRRESSFNLKTELAVSVDTSGMWGCDLAGLGVRHSRVPWPKTVQESGGPLITQLQSQFEKDKYHTKTNIWKVPESSSSHIKLFTSSRSSLQHCPIVKHQPCSPTRTEILQRINPTCNLRDHKSFDTQNTGSIHTTRYRKHQNGNSNSHRDARASLESRDTYRDAVCSTHILLSNKD
jgi:hypothetical protein